jgi:hypothetical protein
MIGLTVLAVLIGYVITAWVVIKRLPNKKAKWIALAIFILIPTWDEILGRIYFKHLCETEGGGQTFKTVEVGKEFFLKPGEIDMGTAGRLPAKGGELNIKKIEGNFPVIRKSTEISKILKIKKSEISITEKATGNVLAKHTNFGYFGGWVARHSVAHVTGIRCSLPDDSYRQFYAATFKPAKSND